VTIENAIIQAGRTWVKAYGNPAGAIGDAQVKNGSLTFQRPQLDYVVVSCLIADRSLTALGDEQLHAVAVGAPTLVVGGKREAVLRFQAFGGTSVEWLSNLKLSLSRPDVMGALSDLGVSFLPQTPVTNIDLSLGVDREQRAYMDMLVNYRVNTAVLGAAEGIVEATTVDLSVDFTETDGGSPVMELDTTITL
tara:strand:+ start:615 stop:1193 length:579 start_codon:yes stop_codon:yes gene_type:complete